MNGRGWNSVSLSGHDSAADNAPLGRSGPCLNAIEQNITDGHSFYVRVATSHLKRNLKAAEKTPVSDVVLSLASDGSAFRVNDEPMVDLARRRPLRRLLLRMSEQHRAHPGQPLSLEELLEAGWPGEKVLTEAGTRRVYVAVSTLRTLGLGELLVTRHNGYMLKPQLDLQIVPLTTVAQ